MEKELKQRLNEAKQESMNEKYSVMINASSDIVSMISNNYIYEAVNDPFCEAHGLNRNDIIGKTIAELWGEETFGREIKQHMDECLKGHTLKYKTWLVFTDKKKKYYEVSMFPNKKNGKAASVVVATRDITDLYKTEIKQKQYVENLTFLSKAAMGFEGLLPEHNLYRYIASCLRELIPDSIVMTGAYQAGGGALKISSLHGLGEKTQKIMKTMGKELVGATYKIDESKMISFSSGKVFKVDNGLYGLLGTSLSKVLCNLVERVYGIENVYAMGFVTKGELSGNAVIIMKGELGQDKKAIVEAFIGQASVALLRRAAEEELKSSEEKMRVLFECAPDAYVLCDAEGRLVDCNRSFKGLTGFDKEEVHGKKIMEMILAEKVEKAVKGKRGGVSSGVDLYPEEYVVMKKDKKELVVELTRYHIKVESVPHTLFIIRDITERKRFVDEIRKLAKFVYESPEPMMRISKEGKLIYANPPGIKLLNELKFEIDKLVPDYWREMSERVIDSGKKMNVEYKIKESVYSFDVVPLKEAGYVNLYGRNITESKASDRALRESEEKYRGLFEESKDAVLIMNNEIKIKDINMAGVAMFGCEKKEDLLGVDTAKWLSFVQEDLRQIGEMLKKHKFVKDYETTVRRRDGKELRVLISATAVVDNDGKIVEVRNIIKDITEKRSMEAQLAQLQKMDSLGMLAGGIAHDFNNLITGILGNISDLRGKLADKNIFAEEITGIEESAKNAAELTSNLLAFARGGKYNVEPMSINDAVAGTARIISRTFGRNIVLRTDLDPDIPSIEADRSQIGQVVMNLCVNAKAAMPRGGELSIKTGSISLSDEDANAFIEARKGDYVYLLVTDNGTGMDKETSQRIFEPFFTTKGEKSGTGLGLSVVYGIVKNHGGFVKVVSEPGKGSEFKVYLPASLKTIKTIPKRTGERIKGHDELVLVIDDEKEIRSLVKRVLENNGYRVLLAENGEDALKVFGRYSKEISLVIIDMVMPETDSDEVFMKMKEIKRDVSVLISTGFSQSEKMDKMMREGAKGVVPKPYNVEDLLYNVNMAIHSGGKG